MTVFCYRCLLLSTLYTATIIIIPFCTAKPFEVQPLGIPEAYLETNDPSLLDYHLENQMDLSSPNPAL